MDKRHCVHVRVTVSHDGEMLSNDPKVERMVNGALFFWGGGGV